MTTFNAQPIVCYHSAQANGTGAITITNVASITEGDILFVPVATQGGEAAPTPTCTGLTFATVDTYQSSGTGVGSVRLTLFWARVGTDAVGSTISVGDSGDHTIGRVTSIKNLPLTGDPWHAVAGNTEGTSDTSGSAPGLTTTANNAVILVYAARGNDSASGTAYSGWTNASLTYVQELWEGGTTDGSGGGIAVAGGPRPTMGTVSATTYTLASGAQKAHITLALVGRSVDNVIVGTDAALPNVYSTYFSWTTFADVFGNSKGFKDNNASGSGDICLFGKCRKGAYGSDTRAVLFWTASTSGTSWTPVELFGGTSDAFWFGFLKCGMQTSDGKLHLCWANLSTGYLVYYRLTPTYTSGHITGYTQDVSFNLLAYDTESRVEFQDVVAPDATHRLMVCLQTHNGDNTIYTGYFGTMPLNASSATDLVGLDGTSSLTQIQVWGGTTASHEHAMLFRQDPSTGDIHVAYGYVMTEASAVPLRRRRLAPSTGITWTVGSETIETTDTANSMISGLYGNSNGVYRLSIDNARQVHIDRLNGDTLTQDVFPVVAMPITAVSSGNAILGVNDAGTEAYIAVVEYSGYSQCGLCVDGVWTMSPVYAGYTSVLGIGGVGWNAGVAGIFMQNVNSLTADHYMSVIREAGGNISVTADSGSSTGAGQSAGILVTRISVADSGAATGAGQTAGTFWGRYVAADAAAASGAGQSANTLVASRLPADSGAATGAGQSQSVLASAVIPASLGEASGAGQVSGAYVGRLVAADAAAAVGAGSIAATIVTALLQATAGAATGAGQEAAVTLGTASGISVAASPGAATGAGQNSNLAATALLPGDAGAAIGVGAAANVVWCQVVVADSAAASGSGQIAATLAGYLTAADSGAASGVGQTASTRVDAVLAADAGASTGAGQAAAVLSSSAGAKVVSADPAAATGAGQSAEVLASHLVEGSAGAGTGQGQTAVTAYGRNLTADSGAAIGAGQAATMFVVAVVSAESGTSTGQGQEAGVTASYVLGAQSGAAVGLGQVADISLVHNVGVAADPGTASGVGADAGVRTTRIAAADPGAALGEGQPALFASGTTVVAGQASGSGEGFGVDVWINRLFAAAYGWATGVGQVAIITPSHIPIIGDWKVVGVVRPWARVEGYVRIN